MKPKDYIEEAFRKANDLTLGFTAAAEQLCSTPDGNVDMPVLIHATSMFLARVIYFVHNEAHGALSLDDLLPIVEKMIRAEFDECAAKDRTLN